MASLPKSFFILKEKNSVSKGKEVLSRIQRQRYLGFERVSVLFAVVSSLALQDYFQDKFATNISK